MSTIKIIQRVRGKIDSKKAYPLYLLVTVNRQSSEISLKHKVTTDQWNESKQKVIGLGPRTSLVNIDITRQLNMIIAIDLKFRGLAAPYNTKDVVLEFKTRRFGTPQGKKDTVEYVLGNYIKDNPKDRPLHTMNNFKAFYKCLTSYRANLQMKDITDAFMDKYFTDLRNTGLALSTIKGRYKFMRFLLRMGVKKKLITQDPLIDYKFPFDNKIVSQKPIYLTLHEVELFAAIKATTSGYQKVIDIFLFMCYTGLRISDVATLAKNHLHLDEQTNTVTLEKKQFKTGHLVKFELIHPAKEILDRYFIYQDKYGFNILTTQTALNDTSINKNDLKEELKRRTAYYNKIIKKYTNLLNIDKNVSTKVGRHSFATNSITMGISLYVVSKLLGHTSISQTQIYAEVAGIKKNEATAIWNQNIK